MKSIEVIPINHILYEKRIMKSIEVIPINHSVQINLS